MYISTVLSKVFKVYETMEKIHNRDPHPSQRKNILLNSISNIILQFFKTNREIDHIYKYIIILV